MFAFLMCCICSKADIQYKGILSSNYTTSKAYICVVAPTFNPVSNGYYSF